MLQRRSGIRAYVLLLGSALVETCMGAAPTVDATNPIDGQWQLHQVHFVYSGLTAHYSCDGMEDKVRDVLLAFDARKDVKVQAGGCSRGLSRPSQMVWVDAQFSTLSPASATAAAAPAPTPGKWVWVELRAEHPYNMDEGDCELIELMQDVLRKNFALRNDQFRAMCFPHEVSLGSYQLKSEVFKPVH